MHIVGISNLYDLVVKRSIRGDVLRVADGAVGGCRDGGFHLLTELVDIREGRGQKLVALLLDVVITSAQQVVDGREIRFGAGQLGIVQTAYHADDIVLYRAIAQTERAQEVRGMVEGVEGRADLRIAVAPHVEALRGVRRCAAAVGAVLDADLLPEIFEGEDLFRKHQFAAAKVIFGIVAVAVEHDVAGRRQGDVARHQRRFGVGHVVGQLRLQESEKENR